MISRRFNCIFVHVPKTAGQSIEHFFLKLHGLSWDSRGDLLLRYNEDPSRGPQRLAHLFSREYVSCGYVSQSDFDMFFKFAFVRNPWDRLVSEYHFRGGRQRENFREFVYNGSRVSGSYLDSSRHLAPQVDYLYDEYGRCLVDFIGRFENLQRDFDVVCSRVGIPDTTMPHVNAAQSNWRISLFAHLLPWLKLHGKRRYTDYYDATLRRCVARWYASDIECFGYRFGSNVE